jgi:hypothetical protein
MKNLTSEEAIKILNNMAPPVSDRVFTIWVTEEGLKKFDKMMKEEAKNYNNEPNKN